MNQNRKPQSAPAILRGGARPPGPRPLALFTLTFLLTFWAERLPDPLSLEMIFAIALWLGLLFHWLVRLIIWLNLRRAGTISRRSLARWSFGPALFVIAIILFRYDIPLRLAFDLSRPALANVIHQATISPAPLPPQRVGLYYLRSAEISRTPGRPLRVTISITESNRFAFIYFLQDPTDHSEIAGMTPLTGSWFIGRVDRK